MSQTKRLGLKGTEWRASLIFLLAETPVFAFAFKTAFVPEAAFAPGITFVPETAFASGITFASETAFAAFAFKAAAVTMFTRAAAETAVSGKTAFAESRAARILTPIRKIWSFRIEVFLIFVAGIPVFVAGLLESRPWTTLRSFPRVAVVHAPKTVGFPGTRAPVETVTPIEAFASVGTRAPVKTVTPVRTRAVVKTSAALFVVSSFTGVTIGKPVGKTPGPVGAFHAVGETSGAFAAFVVCETVPTFKPVVVFRVPAAAKSAVTAGTMKTIPSGAAKTSPILSVSGISLIPAFAFCLEFA